MNVAVSKSFRVGRSVENRTRLLIITLETPGERHSPLGPSAAFIVKVEQHLHYTRSYSEREAARKVQEGLAARRKAQQER